MKTVNEFLLSKGIDGKEAYKLYKKWKKENNSTIQCTTWLNLDYSIL